MISNGKATEGLVQQGFGAMASNGKLLSWFLFCVAIAYFNFIY